MSPPAAFANTCSKFAGTACRAGLARPGGGPASPSCIASQASTPALASAATSTSPARAPARRRVLWRTGVATGPRVRYAASCLSVGSGRPAPLGAERRTSRSAAAWPRARSGRPAAARTCVSGVHGQAGPLQEGRDRPGVLARVARAAAGEDRVEAGARRRAPALVVDRDARLVADLVARGRAAARRGPCPRSRGRSPRRSRRSASSAARRPSMHGARDPLGVGDGVVERRVADDLVGPRRPPAARRCRKSACAQVEPARWKRRMLGISRSPSSSSRGPTSATSGSASSTAARPLEVLGRRSARRG